MKKIISLVALLLTLGCPKPEKTEAPLPAPDVVPNFFATPYGCSPLLLQNNGEAGTKIDDANALLSGETKFQWLTQKSLRALIVVIANEDEIKSFYSCTDGFPEGKIDFETTRVYLLYIEHPKTEELTYVRTSKYAEKMLAEYEVKYGPTATGATTVDIFAYVWPEEVRGMSLKFKNSKK
jgi:hypothetical protein